MENEVQMQCSVTPEEHETIMIRARENGFDEVSAYLKVVALKTQTFSMSPQRSGGEERSVALSFQVTQAQQSKIEEHMKEIGCEDSAIYIRYVALHAVVTAVVEVRSTGDLDTMLKRITESRKPKNLNKLF